MKIIIPFKKEVVFKDNISEITSISLEETLSINEDILKGNFLITGEYLISDNSKSVLPFNLDLPLAIALDYEYDTKSAVCDIDDFYYEIINNQKLAISIDVCIDKLKKKELVDINKKVDNMDLELTRSNNSEINDEVIKEEIENLDRCIDLEDDMEFETKTKMQEKNEQKKEIIQNNFESEKEIKSLFSDMEKEEYISYTIYIVRENDNIDEIINKYNIDIETLKEYNDINELKIGDKIIIPTKCEN